MQWSEVINDPSLRNLPYKIELNKWGNIEMSPASNRLGYFESEISFLLRNALPNGKVIIECSINTPDGVKVANVAWCSLAFYHRHEFVTPYPAAPEICVEIISPSNSAAAIAEKVRLYLAQGASEVWLVDENGVICFHTKDGKQSQSAFIKELPQLPH